LSYFKLLLLGFAPILVAVLGILLIVFGEYDDASGLMLIGLLLIEIAIIVNLKQTLE